MNQNISSVNQMYHGDNEIHQRIQQMINESQDPEFTVFLNQLGSALWQGRINDKFALEELDRTYFEYQQKMQQKSQNGYIYPEQFRDVSKPISQSKRNVEYTVGAGVLGVTGAIFLLIAFTIFAINFMSGLVKGISLYAIAAVVVLISEVLIRKRRPPIASVMTGVGISGLFLSTVINYTYLSLFNDAVAFIIIALIAGLTLFLTYKNDSGVFRIIAIMGSVISLFPMMSVEDDMKYLITCAMVIIIQIAAALISSKKEQRAVWLMQMIIQFLSLALLFARGRIENISVQWIQLYVVLMIALLNLLFLRAKVFTGSVITFCVIYFMNIVMLPKNMLELPNMFFSILPLTIVTLLFTWLIKHNICRWIPYWYLGAVVISSLCQNNSQYAYEWVGFICITVLFISAKMVSRVNVLHVSECIITLTAFIYMLGINKENCLTEINRIAMLLILTICFILSIVSVNYWHAFYELIITATMVLCTAKLCPGIIKLPIITGVIALSIFFFSFRKEGKKEYSIKLYNMLALCMAGVCYLRMIFIDNLYIYIIMLLFGITVLAFIFDEKYRLPGRHKNMCIGCFLTYMFMILHTEYPIINSILLMCTAILCVAMGFISKEKPVRIYGIIMAIVVALKVALIDFGEMEAMQKMLTFLCVGALILVISYIYVILEKKLS